MNSTVDDGLRRILGASQRQPYSAMGFSRALPPVSDAKGAYRRILRLEWRAERSWEGSSNASCWKEG